MDSLRKKYCFPNWFTHSLFIYFFITAVTLLPVNRSFGTHVIGGELVYTALYYDTVNNLIYYSFEVKLYRDCTPGTAQYDSTIYVSIYDDFGDSASLELKFNMLIPLTDTLENNTYNLCLFSPPDICIEEALYKGYAYLVPGNYYMTYQRCCRNDAILNLVDLVAGNNQNDFGAGWYLTIPDPSLFGINSSPVFNYYPPTIICVGDTFLYDHSAIDPDGDSLVYRLCEAFTFKEANYNASPDPPYPPIFEFPVQYVSGYSYLHPLGLSDSMKLDSFTGELSLLPLIIGKYVVAICVDEYRNGVLINTNKRDFQFNVAPCLKKVNAGFNYQIAFCDVNEVMFFSDIDNDAIYYWWDFGIDTSLTDTSGVIDPSYTFPDENTSYIVTQIVNKGYECTDSLKLTVTIPPKLRADFEPDEVCVFDTTRFYDKSYTNSYTGNIIAREWHFGDGTVIYNDPEPEHAYKDTVEYLVSLTVTTDKLCQDKEDHTVKSNALPAVDAGPDVWTTPVESVMLNGSGASLYAWSPGVYLNDSAIQNPFANPAKTTDFILTGTSGKGCRNLDTVRVNVVEPDIILPNAFTPNNDSRNDTLYLIHVGIKNLIDFKIFNRWGEVVFITANLEQGWDGRYKDREQEIGTYVYYYKAETYPGAIIERYGNVALLR